MTKRTSPGDTARKAGILILIAAALAAGINLVHPNRIPWIGNRAESVEARAVSEGIQLAQLSDMINFLRDESRLLVDARSFDEYAWGHLPGAVSVPVAGIEKTTAQLETVIHSVRPPVVYGSGPDSDAALELALNLRDSGCSNVAVFAGGLTLWESEMLSVERTVCREKKEKTGR